MACSTKVITYDCPKLREISTLQTDARSNLPCSVDWLLRSCPIRPERLRLSRLWRIPGRHRRDWRGRAYSLLQIGERRGGSIGFLKNRRIRNRSFHFFLIASGLGIWGDGEAGLVWPRGAEALLLRSV